jgi:ADP-ribose pyrophosphatase YjhB (NUDIX family)
MGLFNFIRKAFGQEVDEQPSNVDGIRANVHELSKALGSAKLSQELIRLNFEEADFELSLKLKGCDEMIAKGKTEFTSTKPYIEDRRVRLENQFIQDMADACEEVRKAEEAHSAAVEDLLKAMGENEFEYQKYMYKSLGRSRDTMPQISKEDLDKILIHFSGVSNGSNVIKKSIKLKKLKPTQFEINNEKVKDMVAKGHVPDYFITSQKNHLLDGHHGWAAALEQKDPESEVTVYQIGLKTKEALRRINLIKSTTRKDIEDNIINKAIDLVAAATDEQKSKVADIMKSYKEGTLEGDWLCKAQVISYAIDQAGIEDNNPQFEEDIQKGIVEDVQAAANKFLANVYDMFPQGAERQGYADAIIRNSEGRILMLRRSKADNFMPGQWSLPGGKMEENEEPIESAMRELTEETNLEAEGGDLILIKDQPNAMIFYYDLGYVADPNALLILDGHEHDAYAWVNENELMTLDCIFDLKDTIIKHVFGGGKIRRTPVYEKIEKTDDGISAFSESLEDTIEKGGKAAAMGEVRVWQGIKWQKTANGWKQLGSGVKHSPAKLKEHAERTSIETLSKVAKNHQDPAVRDAAKREMEERTKDVKKEDRKNKREDKIRAEDKADRKQERNEQWAREDKKEAAAKADEKAKEAAKKPKKKKARKSEQQGGGAVASNEHQRNFIPDKSKGLYDGDFDHFYDTMVSMHPTFDNLVRDLAKQMGGDPIVAPPKTYERSVEKLNKEYGGIENFAKLKDVLRATVVINDAKEIANKVDQLKAKYKDKVIKAFVDFEGDGYQGANFVMEMDGTPVEIQFNTPINMALKDPYDFGHPLIQREMAAMKEQGIQPGMGHSFYEKLRVLDKNMPEKKEKLERAMKKYYAFRNYFGREK